MGFFSERHNIIRAEAIGIPDLVQEYEFVFENLYEWA